ncbi:MAG: hypothetical protein V1773_11380 [bacterium]
MANSYIDSKLEDTYKSWSYYFYSTKIGNGDYKKYFDYGLYFWNKKDKNNIRTNPIEAMELFDKSYKINNNYQTKLYLTYSLVYRAIYNDSDEFVRLFNELLVESKLSSNIYINECICRIILIELELRKLSGEKKLEDKILENYIKDLADYSLLIEEINKAIDECEFVY